MFLTKLTNALDKHKVPYALVGGYAVALHGVVRGTVDIDFVIRWQKKHLLNACKALESIGLQSRLPLSAEDVFNFRDEYINNRNLLAWNFYNPKDQTEQVDLMINFDLGTKKTANATFDTNKIKVLNKKDLVAMKQASGRPQDLADIEALERLS